MIVGKYFYEVNGGKISDSTGQIVAFVAVNNLLTQDSVRVMEVIIAALDAEFPVVVK